MFGIEWIIIYIFLGSFVGFIAGLLGVGGGGILVPLLVSIFTYQGISSENVLHFALGTSLACMIISSTSSIRAHASRGTVDWKVFYGMTPGIMLGAFITAKVASLIDPVYIAVFFSLFMGVVAIQMFLNWRPKSGHNHVKIYELFITGTGIGAVSSLAAVGGGFLSVTYLSYKNIAMKRAIGTSAAIGFPISIAGTVGYMVSGWSKTLDVPYTFGFIYIPAFLAISITSAIAAPFGVRYAHSMPDAKLKKIFAIISLALSIKMLISII